MFTGDHGGWGGRGRTDPGMHGTAWDQAMHRDVCWRAASPPVQDRNRNDWHFAARGPGALQNFRDQIKTFQPIAGLRESSACERLTASCGPAIVIMNCMQHKRKERGWIWPG